MKQILIFLLVLSSTVSINRAQPQTLHSLYWLYSTNEDLEFTHLLQTDTATLLFAKVKNPLREWQLNSKVHLLADQQKLFYRGGNFLVQEEGEIKEYPVLTDQRNQPSYEIKDNQLFLYRDSLVLRFDPLPTMATSFDLIRNDPADYWTWKILGIKWDEQGGYPNLLPTGSGRSPQTHLPTYAPAKGKAVFRGKIEGYREEMKGISRQISSDHSLTNEYYLFEMKDSLGHFSFEADLTHPVWLSTSLAGKSMPPVLLVPGEELILEIDQPALSATDWNDLDSVQSKSLKFHGKYAAISEIARQTPYFSFTMNWLELTYPAYVEMIWEEYQKERQEILLNLAFDGAQKEAADLMAKRKYLKRQTSYTYFLNNEIKDTENGNPISNITMNDLNLRAQEYTLVDPHAHELGYFIQPNAILLTPDTSLIAYAEANKLTDTPYYRWAIQHKAARELATQINGMEVEIPQTAWDAIAPEYIQELKNLHQTILESKRPSIDSVNYRVHELPSVAPEELLPAIAAQFPGKVVVMDFWATWCGPCLRGIETMKPLKKELEGKEVVFVYLTNETSGAAEWLKALPTIDGEHYRISDKIWNQIPRVGAIPQYFIYAPDGTLVLEQTGWNDSLLDPFKSKIHEALEIKN